VILLSVYVAFLFAVPLEQVFFGGDMRLWITNDMGIPYDQRNALVVGLAMGFAVIPTIFSIAEDAIFTVPRQLTYGSLALGATPWQTLSRVVLPTASPGIFSALMIGMGRAVGETMIVLMATGNTPIMDINIFEGMRTLAANIAVEVPESEVDSTHYRILFLAALVLFMFTFVINTLAEIVRQRLRRKYSNL
jgi:phosphate transport system permease protein